MVLLLSSPRTQDSLNECVDIHPRAMGAGHGRKTLLYKIHKEYVPDATYGDCKEKEILSCS